MTSARVSVLRVYCTATWPGLIDECADTMLRVLATKVQRVNRQGCVAVQSYSQHWPCLLPQHGAGKKHERPITLADWQRTVVSHHPGAFLRGLFHSDGCRVENRVTRNGKAYAYPRYMFANESVDIMAMCQQTLDQIGVPWRMCRPNLLSVARREGVVVLDGVVGAKF